MGNGIGTSMGAPLPSRYVVIERVQDRITKEDVKEYMGKKNMELRSIKLMSREDSMFKRYLLEISVKNVDIVVSEEFWPFGVRVRNFLGKGNAWRDREVTVETENQAENEGRENNNNSSSSTA